MNRTVLRMTIRLGLCAMLAGTLAGCGAINGLNIPDWFSSGNKRSNLKGQRIPVLTLENALKPDATLKNTPVTLPKPYVNPEWPEPGGYATNAMYHLEADGPLAPVWQQDCRQGLGFGLAADRTADRRGRPRLCPRFRSPCLCLQRQDRRAAMGQGAFAQGLAESDQRVDLRPHRHGYDGRSQQGHGRRGLLRQRQGLRLHRLRFGVRARCGERPAIVGQPYRRADHQCAGRQWRARVRLVGGQSFLRVGRNATAARSGTIRASANRRRSWRAPARLWPANM